MEFDTIQSISLRFDQMIEKKRQTHSIHAMQNGRVSRSVVTYDIQLALPAYSVHRGGNAHRPFILHLHCSRYAVYISTTLCTVHKPVIGFEIFSFLVAYKFLHTICSDRFVLQDISTQVSCTMRIPLAHSHTFHTSAHCSTLHTLCKVCLLLHIQTFFCTGRKSGKERERERETYTNVAVNREVNERMKERYIKISKRNNNQRSSVRTHISHI